MGLPSLRQQRSRSRRQQHSKLPVLPRHARPCPSMRVCVGSRMRLTAHSFSLHRASKLAGSFRIPLPFAFASVAVDCPPLGGGLCGNPHISCRILQLDSGNNTRNDQLCHAHASVPSCCITWRYSHRRRAVTSQVYQSTFPFHNHFLLSTLFHPYSLALKFAATWRL